jgi:hypothetical protein
VNALLLALSVLAYAGWTSRAAGQPLPESIPGKPGALLANGGFDAGDSAGLPLDWGVEGNADGARIVNRKDDRTAGMAALEIDDAKGSAIVVRSRRITAVPGGTYTLAAKVKGKRGTPAMLCIEFWSFERKPLGQSDITPEFTEDWQSIKLEATAPEGSAHVTACLQAAGESEGTSIWDELELTLAPTTYDPKLGPYRELFLDDERIESAYHVARVVHPAKTTTQPVIRADKPWEDSAYIYGSVYKIGDVYRMWYTAYNDVEPNYHTAYAESSDGLTWTKPNLGLVELRGSKENNLVPGRGTIAYNPDAPPDRRYTSMAFQTGKVNETLGYYVWFSPDGLAWKRASEKPALLDGDVSNISYDPVEKRYIATIKKRMFTARTPGIYERTAFVSTSPDAITWTAPRIAVMGDYADDGAAQAMGGLEAQIYGMPVVRYESTYVGFPWVFQILNYTAGKSARTGDGPVVVQIASSRDLVRWSRPTRASIIEPGPPGAWNDGAHYTASNILVDDEKITMYYAAFNNGHGGSDLSDPNRGKNIGQSGMATWRRDGWVSLTNGSTEGLGNPGQVTTKPITFDGKSLHVNAIVRSGGELRVELLDADGNAISGYAEAQAVPITGNQLDATVAWTGGNAFADLAGRAVKLRFTLLNADLYSFWVAP